MEECGNDVAVIGGGSFGTAISMAVTRSGFPVSLFCHRSDQVEEIILQRENRKFFPGHRLSPLINPTNDLDLCLEKSIIFLASPASTIEYYASVLKNYEYSGTIVNLAKGIHCDYFSFSDLFDNYLPDANYVSLKGPTFAKPMFLGELSGMTCSTKSQKAYQQIINLFSKSMIDIDFCPFPAQVDTMSAIKNIYAIAMGICKSLDVSDNTTYLLVVRIVQEVKLILNHCFSDFSALLTYSGLGDLLLTGMCSSSRNMTFGLMIGRGIYIDMARSGFLSEGVRSLMIIKKKIDVELPILEAVSNILEGYKAPVSILDVLGLKHTSDLFDTGDSLAVKSIRHNRLTTSMNP